MSRNATDDPEIASPTFRATVDLPEPDPPAIPITSGFRRSVLSRAVALLAWDVRVPADEREAAAPSRFCIGTASACATAATSSLSGGNGGDLMRSSLPHRSRSSIARRYERPCRQRIQSAAALEYVSPMSPPASAGARSRDANRAVLPLLLAATLAGCASS